MTMCAECGRTQPNGKECATCRREILSRPCAYSTAHNRLRAMRGPARDWFCARCGDRAEQWAYREGSPREIRGDVPVTRRGKRYVSHMAWSPDPADYVALCAPCHGGLTRPDWGDGYRKQGAEVIAAKLREWHARSYAKQTATPELRQDYRDRKNRERRAAKGSPDGWLTSTQAAAVLGMHVNTVIRRADAGLIPHIKTRGGDRRFDPEALTALQRKEHP